MSPLEGAIRSRGVPMREVGPGIFVPASFGDAGAEHAATRSNAGLFDFSFMGLYEVRGSAALDFLHAVQSRALQSLPPGRLAYTLLLSEGDRVFIDATVWRTGRESWWVFSGRRSDFDWLKRRAAGIPVQLVDRSGEFAVLSLQGPGSGRILSELIGAEQVAALRYFHFLDTRIGNTPMVIGRLGYSGELGYELLVPTVDSVMMWNALAPLVRARDGRECGFDAANLLRIEAGFLLFGREITGAETAGELGLSPLVTNPAVRPLPQVRRLVGLEIAGRPPSHALGGMEAPRAHATSECVSPLLGRPIALGFTDPASAACGTTVRLADGRAARVASLPFYDPPKRRPRAMPL